jgi:HK97 family phage prohead protease
MRRNPKGRACFSLAENGGGRYILNSGKAYDGALVVDFEGARVRMSAAGEMPVLREHDRARVVGAWTDLRIEDGVMSAGGIRWAPTPDAEEAKALVDGGFLWGVSIGFSAKWEEKSGKTFARELEVYEASLVSVAADADSRVSGMTLGMDEDDSDEDTAGASLFRALVSHLHLAHGMDLPAAVVQAHREIEYNPLRALLEGMPAAPEEPAEEPVEEAATLAPAYPGIDFSPPEGVREELRRGLEWHEAGESGDGLQPETVAWARRMADGEDISPEKARAMKAWFARHAADKEGEGFRPDEPGYPSPGRVAWALWGGDPAVAWSDSLVTSMDSADAETKGEQTAPDALAAWLGASPIDALAAWMRRP